MTVDVSRLLQRGDAVAIEQGRLIIRPASGKPVPKHWLDQHGDQLIRQILQLLELTAYRYIGYSTGQYGKHKAAGVTLQFVSVTSGESGFTIFNADLSRSRTTASGKKGERLPGKQFRVSKSSEFYRFWLRTGLRVPQSLSRFHGYMGNLRGLLFIAPVAGDRLIKSGIRLCEVDTASIRQSFNVHKPCISDAHHMHKPCISNMHKESAPAHTAQGFQPSSGACENGHGNKVISRHGDTGSHSHTHTNPVFQSNEEWLVAYGEEDQPPRWH